MQQLFQNSFALMTLPALGMDSGFYQLNRGAPIGNENYFDACDQISNQRYLMSNQLNPNQFSSNQLKSNQINNLITNNLPSKFNKKNSFQSKLKTRDLNKLLKRRYSENVIDNLPTSKMINNSPTLSDLSKSLFLSIVLIRFVRHIFLKIVLIFVAFF